MKPVFVRSPPLPVSPEKSSGGMGVSAVAGAVRALSSMAREWHVASNQRGCGDGCLDAPFSTIQNAAECAQPGDTIWIHSGTYRERIDPPRGGTSEEARISYLAAGDGPVEIKGSEMVEGWRPGSKGAWVVEVPNAMFGDFNPYERTISGHWFYPKGRLHHPGAVYLDGHWLVEAASMDELLLAAPDARLWFAVVGQEVTRISARFGGRDPGAGLVEINVRQTVFYPSQEQRNFLTVRGLTLLHAATPWAPPTTEQIGLIGCHWAKGWIIEDCVVRYSACAGITLGKYCDPEDDPDNAVVEHTNGEDTYHGTIRRALAHGWSLTSVGGHVVRRNIISHCEMAGICGSLGAPLSVIADNRVHDIHRHRLFNGFEQAGIKFHGAIDTLIARNHISRCERGIWLDWMCQGARVTGNLCHDNGPSEDIFLEVNHGPFVVDNNAFLSEVSVKSQSTGGAYLANFFRGRFHAVGEPTRFTPYFAPHSTEIAGWQNIPLGDDRLLNNVFAEVSGSASFDAAELEPVLAGNCYLNGAQPSRFEMLPVARCDSDVKVEITDGVPRWSGKRPLEFPAILASLGVARTSGLPFEDPNFGVLCGGAGQRPALELQAQ